MSSATGSAKGPKRPQPAGNSNRDVCLRRRSLAVPRGSVTMGTPNGPDILTLSYVDMGTRQVPPPEAQLWRFMDLAKLVTMLDRKHSTFRCWPRWTINWRARSRGCRLTRPRGKERMHGTFGGITGLSCL